MTKYSIFWKNTKTGGEGNGTHAFDNLSAALESIKYLNDTHPHIYHYHKAVSSDTLLVKK